MTASKPLPKKNKIRIGWEEWCSFPELGLPAIKAKIDTGARTSSLHAFDIEQFEKNGQSFVRFKINPLQRNTTLTKTCVGLLVDQRQVKSSIGAKERRVVIRTLIQVGKKKWEIDLTLTNRHLMRFRMLLGRRAIRKGFVVYPGKSMLRGKLDQSAIKSLY